MNPKISKELKKATEDLQTKMLAFQEVEARMMKLKTAFVNETDPVKKEKMKPLMISTHKELKAAEALSNKADAVFHNVLKSEPEEDYDLLDHKIQEHIVRMQVRKLVKESIAEFKRKK